jgi:uncharacterized protein with FMN-binding domain
MKNTSVFAMLLTLTITVLFVSCSQKSTSDNAEYDYQTTESEPTEESIETAQAEGEVSIDGVYSGTTDISGLELKARLTISGNRWSAASQLGYDSQEYQNGVVLGSDLYDESGMVKIGYVSGDYAHINGYPTMTR